MTSTNTPATNGRPSSEKITLAALLTRWLAEYEVMAAAGEKAPNTLRTYRILVRGHIVPVLGDRQARALTTAQVNTWLAGLDLADSTRRKCRAILATALSWAMTQGIVPSNVASDSKVEARRQEDERAFLTAEECELLRETVKGHRLEAPILLALGTGLRRGELLGLRWGDVDLAASTVRVGQALVTVGGAAELSQPRTPNSVRVAKVEPFALEAIRRHRDSLHRAPMDTALVFTSRAGTPINPANFARDFADLTEVAGLGRRHAHELRHAYARMMLAAGVPVPALSKQLGHASAVITVGLYGGNPE